MLCGTSILRRGGNLKIILISGAAGSGKDTVAGFLQEKFTKEGYRVLITHFADLVKHVAQSFCGWNGIKDIHGRSVLQIVGTDIVRRWDEDYWVNFIIDMLTLFGGQYDYVLIPDARFPNEVSKIKEKWPDTIHLRVDRKQFKTHLTEEQQHHASETALSSIMPDIWIHNDGDLADLTTMLNDFSTMYKVEDKSDDQISIEEWMRQEG